MDLLKRSLAPVPSAAWKKIDEEARSVLRLHLAARKLTDFEGPHDWTLGAVNLGRTGEPWKVANEQASLRLRRVQPLVELHRPFELGIDELDDVARGSRDVKLGPMVDASRAVATIENRAVFHGMEEAGIQGIVPASPHRSLRLPEDVAEVPRVVVQASEVLREAGVDGPYALALGPRAYASLAHAADDGYPVRKRLERALDDGEIVWAPALDGAVLLSRRGGDFVLTVGQDLSIGYKGHGSSQVDLFFTGSFTFRVLEPQAALAITHD